MCSVKANHDVVEGVRGDEVAQGPDAVDSLYILCTLVRRQGEDNFAELAEQRKCLPHALPGGEGVEAEHARPVRKDEVWEDAASHLDLVQLRLLENLLYRRMAR